ncbi:winged helix-turn-helix domain-containing tetratricopeptide repeat protein [Ruegeria hyattellae]|uniref:winged helix-turn-helix domain-containing tetratricopeptide repeat protein n=1 Tax=Ruegeria hyattellae TaxID=3233337 RepID=UPI00355C5C9C
MKYSFDDITLDLDVRELRKSGVLVSAEPLVFDLIAYFVANADRVISRDELVEAVWEGRFVSDAAVSSAVSSARKALGDDGHQQKFIRTVHGRGFRFFEPVNDAAPAQNSSMAEQPNTKPVIAVLQFTPVSRSPDEDKLGEILSKSIATELYQFRHYGVSFEGKIESQNTSDTDERKFGNSVGADFVLSGNLWVLNGRIRINAHLLDCNGGKKFWADRSDGDLSDTLDTIDQIARRIAATTVGRIDALGQRLTASKPSDILSVSQLILRAQAFYNQVSKKAHTEALDLLSSILEQDPQNSRAQMLIGAIHDMAFFTGWSPEPDQSLRLALKHGRLAIQIDPENALAHAHFGEALLHSHRIPEAQSQYERALNLNPNDVAVITLHAAFLVENGRTKEALDRLILARELDPFELNWIPWIRGEAHFALKEFDAAIADLQEIVFPINNARALLASCYAHAGRQSDAEETLAEFLRVARSEMARFPESPDEWQNYFSRESSNHKSAVQDLLLNGLRMAGLHI